MSFTINEVDFTNYADENTQERYYIITNQNNQKIIEGNKCKRLLGIKIDNKLIFNIHFEDLCKRLVVKCMSL